MTARRVTTSASSEGLIKLCRRFGLLKGGRHFWTTQCDARPFDAKLLHPVNQSGSLEAKLCGGTIASSNDPTGGLKRPKNERSFGVAERHGDSGRPSLRTWTQTLWQAIPMCSIGSAGSGFGSTPSFARITARSMRF